MDKINRIHIARIPYEISTTAQGRLDHYLRAIRAALDDVLEDEVMADVEARITEILAENGVAKNDIITESEVDAIEERLGSPRQFAQDPGDEDEQPKAAGESKKLLRDPDNAYLGGVAAGIAHYFDVDPVFIRLAFVFLTFLSGLGILVYVIFWILTPAAKTPSDKLQMNGRPVTLATLQRYRTTFEHELSHRSAAQTAIASAGRVLMTIIKLIFTVWASFVSLALLVGLTMATSIVFVAPFHAIFASYHLDYLALGLAWATIVAVVGLLLTAVVAVWNKPRREVKFGMLIFLPLTVIALASSAATGVFVANHFGNEYASGKLVKPLAVMTVAQATPTNLMVHTPNDVSLSYVVTSGPVHASYLAYPGLLEVPPISVTEQGSALVVSASNLDKSIPSCFGGLCRKIYLPIRVTLYGPALKTITDQNGTQVTLANANIPSPLSVTATGTSTVTLGNDTLSELTLSAAGSSFIDASASSAQSTMVTVTSSAEVNAPATTELTANLPANCAQTGNQLLFLGGQPSVAIINNVRQTASDLAQNSCIQYENQGPTPPSPPLAP